MFYFEPTFFVKLGYSVVFPNYRGSLGFGEDGVNALPGYVGDVDVSDVHTAVVSCLNRWVSGLMAWQKLQRLDAIAWYNEVSFEFGRNLHLEEV